MGRHSSVRNVRHLKFFEPRDNAFCDGDEEVAPLVGTDGVAVGDHAFDSDTGWSRESQIGRDQCWQVDGAGKEAARARVRHHAFADMGIACERESVGKASWPCCKR